MFIESHYNQLYLGCWGSLIVHKATLNSHTQTHKTNMHSVRNKQTSPALIGPDVFPRVQLIILLYKWTCNYSHDNERSNANKISSMCSPICAGLFLPFTGFVGVYLGPEPCCNINCRQKENTAVKLKWIMFLLALNTFTFSDITAQLKNTVFCE